MSLHKFAEQVAQHGRGDDSLLVHMTPDEVQRLQAFAEANGTTMTINPETGLPEAGFLSDLFKAVAPIALGAFLGPAGLGMSSMMAGVATGGITTLATGSLSRGLMAGLGAYGGAGLGASFMGSGSTALGGAGAEAALQAPSIDSFVGNAEGMTSGDAFNNFLKSDANPAVMGKADVLGAGTKAAMSDPLGFAKGNLGNLAFAAAPIMAGAMVPTTTKLGDPKDTNYIRQFDFNINPETGKPDPLYGVRSMAPVKANEWKDKTFQGQRDLFRQQNPNPYDMGVGSLNQPPQQQPTPMATGGIVALAGGGDVIRMAKGTPPTMLTDEQLYQQTGDWNKAAALRDQQNIALSHYNATDNAAVGANINKWITDNPFATTADINNAIKTSGLTQDIVNPYLTANTNISDAARYALSHASEMPGAGGLAGLNANILKEFKTNPDMNQASIDRLQDIYKVSDADIQRPLSAGSQVAAADMGKAANYLATNPDVQAWINSAEGRDYMLKNPTFDASDIAFTHYQRYGAGEGRKWEEAATKTPTPIVCGPGMRLNAAGTACEPIPVVTPPPTPLPPDVIPDGYYGSGPATGVDYRGNTVSIATPGDITRNADGTSTVVPNIPGREPGGFTGIEELKSKYTAGGGSLGYTARAPKTIAEFNQMHNKQTGDSLAAYNYLMNKGANPVKSGVPKIAMPYDEYVLGKKTSGLKKTGTTDGSTVKGVPGQPQTYFDEKAYLEAHPDVAAEVKAGKFASAYDHWIRYGKAEGRKFLGDYQGYLTAETLANIARESGGDGATSGATTGTTGIGNNSANSISGLAQDANPNISVVSMDTLSPDAAAAAAASAADGAAASAASASGNAPGSDGSPGSGAKRGGLMPRGYAIGGGLGSLGSYSDGGRLLKGPGDGVSDSIPATIGRKQQPARLADGEFVIPARIVSELGNGSTDAGAKKLYAMMDRVQRARGKTTGKNKVAANSRSDKYLPA